MLTDFCKPTLGGIENHVFSLSKKLVEKGHKVAIATVIQKNMAPFSNYDGVAVYRLVSFFQKLPFTSTDSAKKFHPPFQDFLLKQNLKSLVKSFKPDIIHCHGLIAFSYFPTAGQFETPLILTLHHYGFLCPKQNLFFDNKHACNNCFTTACYRCCVSHFDRVKSTFLVNMLNFTRKYLSQIDKFIAVSGFVKQKYLLHLPLSENKTEVIPNFYQFEGSHDKNYECLPSSFILYIGQLSPHKGIDFLLSAYKSSGLNLPLVLLGSKHPDFDYTQHADGKQIIVKENCSRTLLLNALQRCSFVIVPSIWPDPCPTSVLEAMSFGKAVIGSNSGGIPEMVNHEKTGYIINPRNTEEFAYYLTSLVNNPELQKKFGANARRKYLEKFTLEKVVEAILDLYQRLLKE